VGHSRPTSRASHPLGYAYALSGIASRNRLKETCDSTDVKLSCCSLAVRAEPAGLADNPADYAPVLYYLPRGEYGRPPRSWTLGPARSRTAEDVFRGRSGRLRGTRAGLPARMPEATQRLLKPRHGDEAEDSRRGHGDQTGVASLRLFENATADSRQRETHEILWRRSVVHPSKALDRACLCCISLTTEGGERPCPKRRLGPSQGTADSTGDDPQAIL